jgi:hypothetical protein
MKDEECEVGSDESLLLLILSSRPSCIVRKAICACFFAEDLTNSVALRRSICLRQICNQSNSAAPRRCRVGD